jgi:flagellar biosynthetic protein FlhB
MAEEKDSSQKTEEPTPRRIEEALKRGQVAFSRELTNFIMLILITLFIVWIFPNVITKANLQLGNYINQPHNFVEDIQGGDVIKLAISIVSDFGVILIVPFLISIVGAIFSSFIQNGFVYSPEAIMPSLQKISPLNGLKRLFSLRAIIDFIKGLLKLSLVGIAAYLVIRPELDTLEFLHQLDFNSMLVVLLQLISKMFIVICVVMGFIAVVDIIYERFQHHKNLMMTKEEVKEEMRQSEGNPEIKAKLRAVRLERIKKRMIAQVPKADVIITNPTHFAVALKYDKKSMPAPQVIAKGQDYLALKIREIAKKNKVPIVENPPLARALFDSVEVDEYVPFEHYKAVAEIIVKIMKFGNRKN